MDAWVLLKSHSSGTGDAWSLITNITGEGGGTVEVPTGTYKANHGITFSIKPQAVNFSIATQALTFSIKPYTYTFRITTYVNGVPT